MAPKVIFVQPEVTCFEQEVTFFMTGNDIYGSLTKFGVTESKFFATKMAMFFLAFIAEWSGAWNCSWSRKTNFCSHLEVVDSKLGRLKLA